MSSINQNNSNPRLLLGLFLTVLLSTSSCIEELDIESFEFEEFIVVDGKITDELKQHQIEVFNTVPIDQNDTSPLSGLSLWVENQDGVTYQFHEVNPGVYTSLAPFQAQAGHEYKLVFVTEDGNGKRYESIPEALIPSPPISIHQRFAEIPSSETNSNEPGIQFFVDTQDASGEARFFRYEWNDAMQIEVPYPSRFSWDGIEVREREQDLGTCYSFGFSNNLIIHNALGRAENNLVDAATRFVPASSLLLVKRYSIEVTQHSVTANAFNFYRKLKEFNESGGSLFDRQQGSVPGNIVSLEDQSETVLGYFEVSGVKRLRTFFNLQELDEEVVPFIEKSPCLSEEPVNTRLDLGCFYSACDVALELKDSTRAARANYRLFESIRDEYFLHFRRCVDCTAYGGTLLQPDYWVD